MQKKRLRGFGSLCVGQEARALAVALPGLLNQSVEALQFVAYSPVPGIEKRFPADKRQEFSHVLSLAVRSLSVAKEEIDYWESSILTGTWMTLDLDRFIRDALRHFPPSKTNRQFEIDVTGLTHKRINQEATIARSQNEVLALCSRCKLADGSIVQIPMMDFRCHPSPLNLKRLKIALRMLGQSRGVVLNSGASYHYYGFNLLTEGKWLEFLAGCLLLAPFTDSRYIAHRLAEGVANLRITSSKPKKNIPQIVAVIKRGFNKKAAGFVKEGAEVHARA